ncbi:unnamed protein product [Didymodactylos carnosus]|uniref:Peptidase C14 caspase domain-containing protein n=1 Tax=Didymodactylos carnosus TaxID=1234261 RepID=A0A8S2QNS0_9BILA|nr:unnamed protein product [Didymodactylos carnosus]CAF4109803.1 unnamed protein product [Didymodactylos carnosus]
MKAPGGSLVQFACAAGALAADGRGEDRNGLYTKHLLKHIAVPNQDLEHIFRAVGAGVYEESKRKQSPYRVSSIMINEHIYLNTTDENMHILPHPPLPPRQTIVQSNRTTTSKNPETPRLKNDHQEIPMDLQKQLDKNTVPVSRFADTNRTVQSVREPDIIEPQLIDGNVGLEIIKKRGEDKPKFKSQTSWFKKPVRSVVFPDRRLGRVYRGV